MKKIVFIICLFAKASSQLTAQVTTAPNNNVGIGTTTPSSKLHVYSTVPADDITVENTATNGSSSFLLKPGGGTQWSFGATGSSNSQFTNSFFVYNINGTTPGPKFLINSAGNVGIGNTTPKDVLDINSANFRAVNVNEAYDFFNSGTRSFINFGLNARGTNPENTSTTRATPNAGALYGIKLTAQKQFPTANSLENKTVLYGLASEDYWGGYSRRVAAAIYTSDLDQIAVERMRISGTGNVGIGTPDPAAKLHIVGGHRTTQFRLTLPSSDNNNGQGTGDVHLQAWASEPYVSWDAGGIGTNVTNDGGANGFGRLNPNIGQSFIRFITNGGGMQFNTTANNGTFYGNTMYMANGNVGLGSTNLIAKLNVGVKLADKISAITIGNFGDAGNPAAIRQSTGAYDIDFVGYRDVVQNQIGARIRAERVNVYGTGEMQEMDLAFSTSLGGQANQLTEKLRIKSSGNVGIGTNDPQQKLHVAGNIHATGQIIIGTGIDYAKVTNYALAVKGVAIAEKVIVKTYPTWPDYVFSTNYKLRSLASLKAYINVNKHLPDVPSAKVIEKNGVDLASTQAALLKKIEELSLYVIEQDEKSKQQQKLLDAMFEEIKLLKKQRLSRK
jgi:uncharacterized coiled-coil protein SlyX